MWDIIAKPFCIIDRVSMRARVYRSGRTHFRCTRCGQSAFQRERNPIRPEGYRRGRPARQVDTVKASKMLETRPLIEVAKAMGVHRSLLYYRIRRHWMIVPSFRVRTSGRQVSLSYWPWMMDNDPRYDGLVRTVNELVPRTLPAEVRSDVCQDIMVSVLTGEVQESDIKSAVKAHIAQHYRLFPAHSYRTVSLDAPIWGNSGRTIADTLYDVGA